MAEERDEEQFGKQDETGQDKQQPPAGQQGQPQPNAEQGEPQPVGQQNQPGELGQQAQSSSGQTDLGQSGDTDTLAGEQRGFGQGTDGSQNPGGTGGSQGDSGGFVGSQGNSSSDYLQEEGATGESDLASQGQGALEGQDEDIETGQPRSPNEDIEGGTGA